MNKIVSIALFGDGNRYAQYFSSLVLAHLNLFPREEGWGLRVHFDLAVEGDRVGETIHALHDAELIQARRMGSAYSAERQLLLTKCMMWRVAPVFDPAAEYVFSRDLDALPMPRDRAACEQFMLSKAAVHTVHDSMSHAGIMGGLSGFSSFLFRRATGFTSLADVYAYAKKTDAEWAEHGTDQVVLNRMTVSFPHLTLLEHRYSGWASGKPGPYRRAPLDYACEAWSTPLPDAGLSKLSPELAARADGLAPHLGSAGYDHGAARAFWEEHGDQESARQLRECEAG